jgi:hypothetical protein
MNLVSVLFMSMAFLLGLLIREFMPGYFRKKGENLATKEDIAEITRLQKTVEHRFNELIENSKQQHALRTLVADKRMDTHQQAFLRVKRLLGARQDAAVIADCRAWMDAHCLYLTGGARKAMWDAIGCAEARSHYLAEADKAAGDRYATRTYQEEAEKAWNGIMAALGPIVTGVELPALAAEELTAVAKEIEA